MKLTPNIVFHVFDITNRSSHEDLMLQLKEEKKMTQKIVFWPTTNKLSHEDLMLQLKAKGIKLKPKIVFRAISNEPSHEEVMLQLKAERIKEFVFCPTTNKLSHSNAIFLQIHLFK